MGRLESDLESEVNRWAKAEGGYSLKLKIDSKRGWPDRTIFLPEGRLIIPELKRPKKNDGGSFNQHLWVDRLTRLGFVSGFCETLEEVKQLLER